MLALLAHLAAAPAVCRGDGPVSLAVSTVAELAAAIGPNRTIRLAAGDYDLSLPGPRTDFVERTGSRVEVRDVPHLTLEGPTAGEARLLAPASFALVFRNASDLRLRRIVLGDSRRVTPRPLQPPILDLVFDQTVGLRLEGLRVGRSARAQLRFDGGEDLSLLDVQSAGTLILEARGAKGLRIERSSFALPEGEPALRLDSVRSATLSQVTFAAVAAAGTTLRRAFEIAGATGPLQLREVALVDEVTGDERSRVVDGPLPDATPARRGDEGVVVTRTPPAASALANDSVTLPVRLMLLDGRLVAANVPTEYAYADGIAVSTLRARRLGSSGSPILVTWNDQAMGQGNYQAQFYSLLDGGGATEPLLTGAEAISGHSGWASWYRATIDFALGRGILIRRIAKQSSEPRATPAPGCEASALAGEFVCETAEVVETRYRIVDQRAAPVSFDEFRRLEPGIATRTLAAAGWRPSRPGPLAAEPGAWWRRSLSLTDGAAKYPARSPLSVRP